MPTLRILPTSSAAIRSSVLQVAAVDETEPLEREELVDRLDRARLRRDQPGVSAGGDDTRAGADLIPNALAQPIDQRDVSVDDPRLDRVYRGLTDDTRRLDQLDARQLRRARNQRVERDAEAGRDDAAEVLPARR